MSLYKLRKHVLVRFKGDPVLLHHRVVVGVSERGVAVISPDRVVHLVRLQLGDRYDRIVNWDGSRLPRGITSKQCYRDRDSKRGKFTPDDIDRAIISAKEKMTEKGWIGPANTKGSTGATPIPTCPW